MPHRVAEQGVTPLDGPGNGLGVRVEEQLGRVEAVASLWLVGSVHPVAIELPRAYARQVDVPDLIGLFRHADSRDFSVAVRPIKQAQLDLGGVLRKEREVNSGSVRSAEH